MKRISSEELEFLDEMTARIDGRGFTGCSVEHEDGETYVQTFVAGVANGPEFSLGEKGFLLEYKNAIKGGRIAGPSYEWDDEGGLKVERIEDYRGGLRILREWNSSGVLVAEKGRISGRRKPGREAEGGDLSPWRKVPEIVDSGSERAGVFTEAVKLSGLEDRGEGVGFYSGGQIFTGEACICNDGGGVEVRTFIEGMEDGVVLTWAASGKLVVQGVRRYPYGPVGPWHEWGEDGRLLRETIYDALGNKIIVREFDEAGNMAHEEKTPPTRLMRDPETGEERPAPWL
ncbi:hypothetical protein [Nocardiopsis synnemataformans]|uniref:hypothetical protein n=1 Tax=Nocardiopsis synnemataformans TaxID=61305 RepID=UPI003EBEB9FB